MVRICGSFAKLLIYLFVSLLPLASSFGAELPRDFKAEKVEVEKLKYNVYRAGTGSTVLLLHGYAEAAQMWFPLMERWKTRYTIIAPDLKGIGESSIGGAGYDKKTVAVEIKGILDHYGVKSAIVIGHDIGLMVAYAFAAQFPQMTTRLVLMDAFLPGIGPGNDIYNDPSIWHFRFNGPYAETLVKGRERIFFDSLWNGFAARPEKFQDAQRDFYTSLYARPGRMRAGWEYFRAMPQDAKDNAALMAKKLKMPVLSMGGEKSLGKAMATTVKEISENPSSQIISNCGHWMMEECQAETVAALEAFISTDARSSPGAR